MERASLVAIVVGVAVSRGRLEEAVSCTIDGTTLASVDGHVVDVLVVDTLDDVNLAIVWPVRSKSPAMAVSFVRKSCKGYYLQGRPGTHNTAGHVVEV